MAIDTTTRAPRDYRIYDKIIIAITSPIQSAIRWSIDEGVEFFQDYIYLFHTRQENVALLETNRKLLNQIAQLHETQHENERLRKYMDFQQKNQFESVVAQVIAKDVSQEFRAIRINRGSSSGIEVNQAVLTDEGIVGRVLRVTPTTADIVTILDLLSAVDATVERSRARGIVEGYTEQLCQLRYALRTDDIQPGDVLVTSGLGGLFPKGVQVGTVSKVRRKSFGISQEVEVTPNVDFSKLEEVMVIKALK